jgi:hypothetical protein
LCCSLYDEVWEVSFHFIGVDSLERTICRSDIIVLNLFSLIEMHGYGIRDPMYYGRKEKEW